MCQAEEPARVRSRRSLLERKSRRRQWCIKTAEDDMLMSVYIDRRPLVKQPDAQWRLNRPAAIREDHDPAIELRETRRVGFSPIRVNVDLCIAIEDSELPVVERKREPRFTSIS
jgi:hypothetical protein